LGRNARKWKFAADLRDLPGAPGKAACPVRIGSDTEHILPAASGAGSQPARHDLSDRRDPEAGVSRALSC
jgi:hypothetical protein